MLQSPHLVTPGPVLPPETIHSCWYTSDKPTCCVEVGNKWPSDHLWGEVRKIGSINQPDTQETNILAATKVKTL